TPSPLALRERERTHILQPRAGSASAFTATARHSLLLPVRSRRDMSRTGLPAAESVNLPRGPSTGVLRIAAASCSRLPRSPPTAFRPLARICAAAVHIHAH